MKYLCLIYSDEQVLHTSADSPHDSECFAYAEAIQASRLLRGNPLGKLGSCMVDVSFFRFSRFQEFTG